jgi:hypothetical protein
MRGVDKDHTHYAHLLVCPLSDYSLRYASERVTFDGLRMPLITFVIRGVVLRVDHDLAVCISYFLCDLREARDFDRIVTQPG